MAQETRKQQIARRLGLTERALEQYLQLKRAEVEDEQRSGDSFPGVDMRRLAERRSTPPGAAEKHP